MSASDRVMSVNALPRLTGWDRGTIDAWLQKGCPSESPHREPGEDHELDIGKVWRWHVERAKADALRTAGSAGADGVRGFTGWMGIREPGKAFDAQLKLMKVAEKAEALVLFERWEAILGLVMNAIRTNVMTVPDVIYREMSGFLEDKALAWRRMALDQCRNALIGADRDIAKAMEADAAAAEADDALSQA